MSRKRGVCKLTGSEGPLVDCHIIPKSLTRPGWSGAPLLQSTQGKGLKKRFSSWYDKNIVTRKGEDILRDIDDPAIKALRKLQLVWSGWRVFKPVFEKMSPSVHDHSFRHVRIENAEVIYKFLASILWRASVSTLPEAKRFKLKPQIETEMKAIVLGEIQPDFWKYTVSLIQLSSVGEAQNFFPMLEEKILPDGKVVLMARIYVDGLIAHFHLDDPSEKATETDSSLFLGQARKTFILGIKYEASYQFENLLIIAAESYGPLSWLKEDGTF